MGYIMMGALLGPGTPRWNDGGTHTPNPDHCVQPNNHFI